MIFSGLVWCHVPAGEHPLHLGNIWKHADGRWNRCGEFPCLYTALTREGALAELMKAREKNEDGARDARDLVSIAVELLDPVLDLTDGDACSRLTRAAGCPDDPELLIAGSDEAIEHCRSLARQARADGFTGLVVPSAAERGEANLAIYFDVVRPAQVRLDDGPDRVRIPAA